MAKTGMRQVSAAAINANTDASATKGMNGHPVAALGKSAAGGVPEAAAERLQAALNALNADQVERAEVLLEELRPTLPSNGDVQQMLGVVALRRGRLDDAADFMQQACKYNPKKAEHLLNLAVVERTRGQLDDARRALKKCLKLAPEFAEAHANMGNVMADLDRVDEAVTHYRRAVTLRPGHPETWHNFAVALAVNGRMEEAYATIGEAEAAGVDCRAAYHRVGYSLLERGEAEQAMLVFAEALQIDGEDVRAIVGMARSLSAQRRREEARVLLEKGLEIHPDEPDLLEGLGYLCGICEDFERARHYLRRKLEFCPDSPGTIANLAVIAKRLDEDDEAERLCREALDLDPNQPSAHAILANVLKIRGEFDEALRHFEVALGRTKEHGNLLHGIYGIKKDVTEEDDVAAILASLEAEERISQDDLISYNFTLGDVFDRLKSPKRAIFYYKAGNDLRQLDLKMKGDVYNRRMHEDFVAANEKVFTPELFEALRGIGHESARPIFIVGMPRSGTTLTEQIVSSHPLVHGAGELSYARRIMREKSAEVAKGDPAKAFPLWVRDLDREGARALAERYLDLVAALDGEAERVTDKMPHNFQLLGLLAVIFPNATFIHCRRDPVDTCLSCFRQNFRMPHPYSNNLSDLGHHYRLHDRLMAHWHKVLPMPIHEARYEEMVADQERASRDLIAFCGLPWDDACLQFHEQKRDIKTASVWQVRQPIYKQSVARWKRYEPYIGDLLDALGLAEPA